MTNSTTTQVMLDGSRNAIIKFEGVLDTSDLGSTVVVDPAQLVGIDNTLGRKATGFRITKLTYNVKGNLSLNLFWDGTTPGHIQELSGVDNTLFDQFGGLTNNAVGPTGKITASTTGWTGISTFSVIMELTKTGA